MDKQSLCHTVCTHDTKRSVPSFSFKFWNTENVLTEYKKRRRSWCQIFSTFLKTWTSSTVHQISQNSTLKVKQNYCNYIQVGDTEVFVFNPLNMSLNSVLNSLDKQNLWIESGRNSKGKNITLDKFWKDLPVPRNSMVEKLVCKTCKSGMNLNPARTLLFLQ